MYKGNAIKLTWKAATRSIKAAVNRKFISLF